MPADAEDTREGAADLIIDCACALDDGAFDRWLKMFTADGVYAAYTADNFAESGLALFYDQGFDGLSERVAFWLGLWQTPRGRVTHIVGRPGFTRVAADEVETRTKFLIARTGHDGLTALHAAGEYRDHIVRTPAGWRFAKHVAIVDCDTLPSNFTDPI